MIIDHDLFHKLFDKYQFKEPVDIDIQQHIRKTKKAQFKKTLKKAGGYSITFGLVSYIFFTLKKMAVSISIVKSAVLLAITSAVVTGFLGTGIYFSVKYVQSLSVDNGLNQSNDKENVLVNEKPFDTQVTDRKDIANTNKIEEYKNFKNESETVIENRLGVQPFTTAKGENNSAHDISEKIANNLISLKGNERVINLQKGRRKIGMMLFGSIEPFENTYIVTAKIVSVKNSKVLFYTTEVMKSLDEIDSASYKISKQIADYLK